MASAKSSSLTQGVVSNGGASKSFKNERKKEKTFMVLQIVLSLWKIWDQESPKQQGKNVPDLSCSKAWAWIYREEMPYV